MYSKTMTVVKLATSNKINNFTGLTDYSWSRAGCSSRASIVWHCSS